MARSSSAWGIVPKIETANLLDIMSDELAKELQLKDNEVVIRNSCQSNAVVNIEPVVPNFSSDDTELPVEDRRLIASDAKIAQLLQREYDRQHNNYLNLTEKKLNGHSKVSVTFDSMRRCLSSSLTDDSNDSEPDDNNYFDKEPQSHDWDRFDSLHRDLAAMPARGYCVRNGNMITKHDKEISGRQNACRMLSFPPEFHTGDGENFDMKLPNKVFNSLKTYSRRNRAHDRHEAHVTAYFSLNEKTRLIIYKLINREVLDHVTGVISIGKEAVVLQGETADKNQFCALKVFKTTLAEFKQRDKYIRGDHRFQQRLGNQSASKTVNLWAEKETRNLNRLQTAIIPSPRVIALVGHVLVMELIGSGGQAAPKLKDARMVFDDLVVAYEQILMLMKRLYNDARLVHADLSEYNILWHNNQCYLIDLSQSLETDHPNASLFLMRDCRNISNFFTRKKLPEVLPPKDLFKTITNSEFTEKMAHQVVNDASVKLKPHMINSEDGTLKTNDNFEEAWLQSQQIITTVSITKDLTESTESLIEPTPA